MKNDRLKPHANVVHTIARHDLPLPRDGWEDGFDGMYFSTSNLCLLREGCLILISSSVPLRTRSVKFMLCFRVAIGPLQTVVSLHRMATPLCGHKYVQTMVPTPIVCPGCKKASTASPPCPEFSSSRRTISLTTLAPSIRVLYRT